METCEPSPTTTWIWHMEESRRSLEEHVGACFNSSTLRQVPCSKHTLMMELKYTRGHIWILQ